MQTRLFIAGIFAFLILCSGIFAKEGATGIVGQRMNAMSNMGRALKVVNTELRKGTRADMNLLELNLEKLAREAELIDLLFEAEEYGQGTEALPIIWQERTDFSSAAQRLNLQIGELMRAQQNADSATMKRAMRDVQSGCNSCHDRFRAE